MRHSPLLSTDAGLPSKQIVLTATLQRSEARIGWTLAKAQDTPLAIRDLDRDDLAALA